MRIIYLINVVIMSACFIKFISIGNFLMSAIVLSVACGWTSAFLESKNAREYE